MGTSPFINALRRFIAIRGNVVNFRSDRGTNFVGSTDYLSVDAINVEDGPIKDFMCRNRISWIFNPPHSSHMGGVWERMIGITRRILVSMMSDCSDLSGIGITEGSPEPELEEIKGLVRGGWAMADSLRLT